ncbi:MAG: hypothetical protein CSB06_03260 [Bacteroidia bacterium]|nr:MAG: hypothetical protein CSB06_03260 [Bacteroidia bacterium]
MEQERVIVVPCDFSETSRTAVDYALQISSVSDIRVLLLHIVPGRSYIRKAEDKFKKILKELPEKYIKYISYGIRVGNIFVDINRTIQEKKALFSVMGTHGLSSAQELTGSRTLKVISNSEVPFLIVQDKPYYNKAFERILFPIDFKLSREKLEWAERIYAIFHSEFYVSPIKYEDDFFRSKQEENRLLTEEFFKQREIPYTVKDIPDGNISMNMIRLARQKRVDIILIDTMPGNNIIDLMLGVPEQEIIANKYKIPVLVINRLPYEL